MAARYQGWFAQLYKLEQSTPIGTISATALAVSTNMTWSYVRGPDAVPGMLGSGTQFRPGAGQVTVTVAYTETSCIAKCAGTAAQTFDYVDGGSKLFITDAAQYAMDVAIDGDNLKMQVTVTCTPVIGPSYTKTVDAAYPVHFDSPLL